MARVLAVALAAFALAGTALAAGNPHHSLAPPSQRLKAAEVKRIFLQDGKVAGWLRHYPRGRLGTGAVAVWPDCGPDRKSAG